MRITVPGVLTLSIGLVVIGTLARVVMQTDQPGTPDISFAPDSVSPVDFARLERERPLTNTGLAALTPQAFKGLSQEQVDQIYARLTAGRIPAGAYDGDLFFPRGSSGNSRLGEILGGRLTTQLGNVAVRQVERVARALWQGKLFDRRERLARNRIEDLALVTPFVGGDSDGIERVSIGGREAFLLFPAKVYCGQSLLDGRRESIVIDYAFADQLPGYREKPDALAGREGFRLRDEIRLIRPGFYLGRAYVDRVFALNFTLSASPGNADSQEGEDCWIGSQQRASAR